MNSIRLWHDDIRPAPEGWLWARTNDAAIAALGLHDVVEISLDHDLGMHEYTEEQIADNTELIFGRGQAKETGVDLVVWMIENDLVPPIITIHSWNPSGAKAMAALLNDAGHNVVVAPFKIPNTITLNID